MAFRSCLTVCAIIGVFSLVSLKVEGDNCVECTMKMDTVIESMQDALRKRDPITIDTPKPCAECTFGGIYTVETAGDVCTEECKEEGVTCYDHRLKLNFHQINISCACELPCNPAEIPKLMAESAESSASSMKCVEKGQSPIDPNKMAASGAQKMAESNPMDLMEMKECQPKFAPPAMFGGKPPPTTVKGGVFGQYEDFNIEVVLRKCMNDGKVRTTEVKLGSVKNSVITCTGTQENYNEACNCFAKTGFTDKMMYSFVNGLFPCYGDNKFSDNADLLQELSCETL